MHVTSATEREEDKNGMHTCFETAKATNGMHTPVRETRIHSSILVRCRHGNTRGGDGKATRYALYVVLRSTRLRQRAATYYHSYTTLT
jgi:hypothetical protein